MRRAAILALVVMAAGLAWLGPGRVQSQTGPERQAALAAAAAPLFDQLAEIRGIATPGPPPPVTFQSRAENRRFIEQEINRRYSQAQIEAERKSMVAWGVLPADYDLQRLFVDLLEEQVSAYYDPRGKVMVVGDWLPADQQRAALTHELVHALQDRELPIDSFITPDPGQGDRHQPAARSLDDPGTDRGKFRWSRHRQGAEVRAGPSALSLHRRSRLRLR